MATLQELTDLVTITLRNLPAEEFLASKGSDPNTVVIELGNSFVVLPLGELIARRSSPNGFIQYVRDKRTELYIKYGKSLEKVTNEK